MDSNKINQLFNIILDKNFIMEDLKITNKFAIVKEKQICDKINEEAVYEGYYLTKKMVNINF